MWQKGQYTQLAAPQYPPYPQTQHQYAQYTRSPYTNGGQAKRQNPAPYNYGQYSKQQQRQKQQQQQQQHYMGQQWQNQGNSNYTSNSSHPDVVTGYPTAMPYGLRLSNPYYDSGYQSSDPAQSDLNHMYATPQSQQQPQPRRPSKQRSEEEEEDEDSEAIPRSRLIKIVIVVILFVVIGIIVAAIAVWLALNTSEEDSPYEITYNVIVKLDEDWHNDLENANSVTYYELEMDYCTAMSSIYDGLFKKCTVQQFLEGSVLVDSALTFDLQKLEARIRNLGHTPDEFNLIGSLIKDLREGIASKEYPVFLNAEINTFNKFMHYQFIIKFDETFLTAWSNPEDPAFKAKEQEYCQDMRTILGDVYANCGIQEMMPGSTIINSKVTLDLKALIALTGDPEATNKDFISTLTKVVDEAIRDGSPKKFKNAEIQSINKFQKVLVVPFESSMTLQDVYNPAYANLNSPEAKELSDTFCTEITSLYKESEIGPAYQGCEVTNITSGSVIIAYVSSFVQDKLEESEGDVTKVKDIVVAAIAQSSGLLGKADPNSITVVEKKPVVAQSSGKAPIVPSETTLRPTQAPSVTSSAQPSSKVTDSESVATTTTLSANEDTSVITSQASTAQTEVSSTQSSQETSTQSQTTTEAAAGSTSTIGTTAETMESTTDVTTTSTVDTTTEATTTIAETTDSTADVTTTSTIDTTTEPTTTIAETTATTVISTTQAETSTMAPSTATSVSATTSEENTQDSR